MNLKLFILIFTLNATLLVSQNDENIATLFFSKIDTLAHLNCTQEELDSVIFYSVQNPKFVIENNISAKAKVRFSINDTFLVSFNTRDVELNMVFRNKVSKKYSDEIIKYYKKQIENILFNVCDLFIPKRVDGKYKITQFYVNIDFTKNISMPNDTALSKKFNSDVLSNNTILYNKKIRQKGIEMLKKKKLNLALVYLRMGLSINKDSESAILLGNLFDSMGKTEAACYNWEVAKNLGSTKVDELLIKCNKK